MKKIIPFICTLILLSGNCALNAKADNLFETDPPDSEYSEELSTDEYSTSLSDDIMTSESTSETVTTLALTEDDDESERSTSGNFFYLIIGIVIGAATSALIMTNIQRMKQGSSDALKQNDAEKIKNSLKETNRNFQKLYDVSKNVCQSLENESEYISQLTKDKDNE